MKKKKKNGLTIKKIFKEAGATNMKKKKSITNMKSTKLPLLNKHKNKRVILGKYVKINLTTVIIFAMNVELRWMKLIDDLEDRYFMEIVNQHELEDNRGLFRLCLRLVL